MDKTTLHNMSCGLRKFDFCIYENKGTGQLEGGNCAAASRVGDRRFFKVLLCNLSSFCLIFSSPVQSTGRAIVVTLASALPLPFPSHHF